MAPEKKVEVAELNDEKFISDPTAWPNWPILPLKRYIGASMPQFAIVLATAKGGDPVKILVGVNMWDKWTQEQVMAAPLMTPAEIVANGWVVD